MIPKQTNGTSSKNIHGLLYSTKNRTECSFPNGLINRKINEAIRAQKNDLHRVFNGKQQLTSSKLNNTPPIGAPKATDTPAAAAADKISLFFASFLPYFENKYDNILPEIIRHNDYLLI